MSKSNLTHRKKHALQCGVCLCVIVTLSSCARVPKPDLTTTASIQQNIQPNQLAAAPQNSDVLEGARTSASTPIAAPQNSQAIQTITDADSGATLTLGAPTPKSTQTQLPGKQNGLATPQDMMEVAPREIAVLKVKSVEERAIAADEITEKPAKKPTLLGWLNKKRNAKTDRLAEAKTKKMVNTASQSLRKTTVKAEQKKPTFFGMFQNNKVEKLPSNIDPVQTASIGDQSAEKGGKAASIDLGSGITNKDKASKATLTLFDVVKKTLETNPEVGIAVARERDAKEAVAIAGADYYPSVDLEMASGLENTFVETNQELAVNRTDANLQLNQKLFDFGITKSKIERQEKLLESARLRRIDKSEEIAFRVVEAYLEVLKQTDLAATAQRNVDAHKKMAKLVEISEKEGNASLADVKRVQTRLDSAKSAVLDIENNLKSSIGAFKRITDIDPEKLKRPKTITAQLGKVSKSEIPAVARANFGLRALASDRESLDLQLKQQFGQRYPEFFVQAQANYKNNNAGETGRTVDMRGMLGMRYRLFDGGKRRATERQIDARSLEAELNYQKTYRELVEKLDDNAQAIQSSEEKSTFLADSVKAARKVVTLYTEQFKLAEKSPFELLDAQQDLYNAEREMITNKFDAANATFNNLKLRGTLIHYLLK